MKATIGRLFLTSTIVMTLAACAADQRYQSSTAKPVKPVTSAPAVTPADGTWRVGVSVTSFFDGDLGRIDQTVDVAGGGFRSGFRDGSLEVAMTVNISGGWAKGQMAVDPGYQWNTASIPFEGPIVDGVLQLDLTGFATYEHFGSVWSRDRDARTLDVKLRLEKRPQS